jgi:hypothetical protein
MVEQAGLVELAELESQQEEEWALVTRRYKELVSLLLAFLQRYHRPERHRLVLGQQRRKD